MAAVGRPVVGQPLGAIAVVPLQEGADPTGGQADVLGGLGRGQGVIGSGQEPEDLPVDLGDAVATGAIAASNLLVGQVGDDRQSWSGHGGSLRACTTPILGLAFNRIPYHSTARSRSLKGDANG